MFVTNSLLMSKLIYIERTLGSLQTIENRLDKVEQSIETVTGDLRDNNTNLLDTCKEVINQQVSNQTCKNCAKLIAGLDTRLDTLHQAILNSDKIINTKLQVILKENSKTTEKLDSLFFENEIFKHQLSLEDDIRRYIQEIDDLSEIIAENVKIIDSLIDK